jgi:hypothetical protein
MNVREKLLQVNMLGRMSKYANKEQIQSRLIEMNESTRIGNYIGEGTTEDLMKQAIENEK